MKTKKLLRKIRALLSADRRAQLTKYRSLEKVLRKLEEKEATLREKLAAEQDEDRRERLQQKLEVIAAQQVKGRKLRDELQPLRDPD